MKANKLPQIDPESLTYEQCIRLIKIFNEDFNKRHPELCTTELSDEFNVLFNTIYDENLFKAGLYDIYFEYCTDYYQILRETV